MKQWQEFGARQSDIRVSENFVCAADELGLILVNGADAGDFLQNQLSNDIAPWNRWSKSTVLYK